LGAASARPSRTRKRTRGDERVELIASVDVTDLVRSQNADHQRPEALARMLARLEHEPHEPQIHEGW